MAMVMAATLFLRRIGSKFGIEIAGEVSEAGWEVWRMRTPFGGRILPSPPFFFFAVVRYNNPSIVHRFHIHRIVLIEKEIYCGGGRRGGSSSVCSTVKVPAERSVLKR